MRPDVPVIVIVDDDDDCRSLIRDAIESSETRCQVVECRDGEEGLAFLRRASRGREAPPPAIIFLDLEMPGKHGQEVLAELREEPQWRHLPVIILTSLDDDEQEARALRNGANSYACKGADPGRMFEVVVNAATYWTRIHRPLQVAA